MQGWVAYLPTPDFMPLLRHLTTFSIILTASVHAVDPAPALRILRDECLGCHKPGKAKGGLLLTTREKVIAGGDTGSALQAGKGKDSLLFQVLSADHDNHMPPKKQMGAAEMEAIRAWIDAGAAWDARVFEELPSVKPVKLSPLPSAYQPVLALALAPDGKRLAVASANVITIHDLSKADRPVIAKLIGHVEAVQSLAWSADGKTIASGGFRQVKIWDVESAKEKGMFSGIMIGNITALAMKKDGSTVFAADGLPGNGGFIHRLDMAQMKISATWKAHDDLIYGLRLSPKGDRLLTASADKLARLWNVADGKLITFFEGHTNHVLAADFNADATQIVTAGADREIKVWDVATRNQEIKLGDKKSVYSAVGWTPDGKSLVAVTDKGAGSIFTELQKHSGTERSETGKEKKLAAVGQMLYSLSVTADGKTIFAGGDDGIVHIWDGSGKALDKIQPGEAKRPVAALPK